MRIVDIIAREIFDSRGKPTVEIEIRTASAAFRAAIPSGRSTGRWEVRALRFPQANAAARYIARRIRKKHFRSVEALDTFLIGLDGTTRKTKLGGNVMLGISIAYARVLASRKRRELWEELNKEFFPTVTSAPRPLIFSNFINGGLHAPESGLNIQEYLAVMGGSGSMASRVRKLVLIYRALGEALRLEQNTAGLALGDEAGYAFRFRNNFEPILVLEQTIKRLRLISSCRIGTDAAASSFASGTAYRFGGRRIGRKKLAGMYRNWMRRVPLLSSFEDPFAERDTEGFRMFKRMAGNAWVIGDDLTVTNPRLILRAARGGLVNGVIIKPNQIGTVTETCRAIQAARDERLRVIVSHRSGETEDTFIIHLAKACGADGVKIGAPARERMVKFNELIRLYDR